MSVLNLAISQSWPAMSADRLLNFAPILGGFGGMPMAGSFFSIMRVILAMVFVSVLAWYVVKLMASQGRFGRGRGAGNLQIIESVAVTRESFIQLVKAGEKYFVIGITKENITMLAEIDKDDISEDESPITALPNVPFGKILQKFIKPPNSSDEKEKLNDEDES